MPNIWTHLIFGQEVLRKLGEERLIAEPGHRNLFNLGCQGPDFLFYHHFLPWKDGRAMNALGSAMHSKQCGSALMALLDAVAGRSADRQTPDAAVVYALGFVLHHTLDRNVHPYVFSRSGFRKWDHQRFEVMMDTLVVRRRLGLETWKTPVWKLIDIGGRLPDGIAGAFARIAERFYPEFAGRIGPGDWDQACRDMVNAQRLFYDPTGVRRILTFGRIEPLSYKRRVPPLDILNEQGRAWLDPTDDTRRRTETFDELWDAAMEESLAIVGLVLEWLRREPVPGVARDADADALRAAAEELIGDRSYETGLPCGSAAIRFADPIWPDGGGAQPQKGTAESV